MPPRDIISLRMGTTTLMTKAMKVKMATKAKKGTTKAKMATMTAKKATKAKKPPPTKPHTNHPPPTKRPSK